MKSPLIGNLVSHGNIVFASIERTIGVFKDVKSLVLESSTPVNLDKVLEGHTGIVRQLLIVGNNELWSCSDDNSIRVWSLTTLECLKVLEDHKHAINCILDVGDHIWSAGWETRIRIWNKEV